MLLSTDDYARFAGVIRVNPPVREARNQQPLWNALADGTIDMIATDHAPIRAKEKTRTTSGPSIAAFPGRNANAADATRSTPGDSTISDYVRWSARAPQKSGGSIRARSHSTRRRADIAIAISRVNGDR